MSDLERENAINNMNFNKSLGSDGLPVEFYVSFWPEVKSLVVES